MGGEIFNTNPIAPRYFSFDTKQKKMFNLVILFFVWILYYANVLFGGLGALYLHYRQT